MNVTLKKIFVFSFLIFGLSSNGFAYDLTVEPQRLKFTPQAASGLQSKNLVLWLDDKILALNSCGEDNWAKHIASQYNQILKKAEESSKMVRLTGSKLCTLTNNEKTIRLKIID